MHAAPSTEKRATEPRHLTGLGLENFRSFRSFTMHGLKRVNLLVGSNGAGKTTILEAASLLLTAWNRVLLQEISERRGEMETVSFASLPAPAPCYGLKPLLFGSKLKLGTQFSIADPDSNGPRLDARIESADSVSDNLKPNLIAAGLTPFCSMNAEWHNDGVLQQRISAAVMQSGAVPGQEHRLTGSVSEVAAKSLNPEKPCLVIWAGLIQNRSLLRSLWNASTGRSGARGRIIESLSLVLPGIQDLVFAGDPGSVPGPAHAGFKVEMSEMEETLNVGSLGDGVSRILHLALALDATRGGTLCVDEIDDGLHYSKMTDMWSLLTERSVEIGNQVFATTHSWDCIEGLAEACRRNPEFLEHVAIHRIDRDRPESLCYDGESILSLMRETLDPR